MTTRRDEPGRVPRAESLDRLANLFRRSGVRNAKRARELGRQADRMIEFAATEFQTGNTAPTSRLIGDLLGLLGWQRYER